MCQCKYVRLKTSPHVCVDINLLSKKNWMQELKAVFTSICTFGIVYRHLLFAKAFDLIGSYVIDMVTKTVHRALAEPADLCKWQSTRVRSHEYESLFRVTNVAQVARLSIYVSIHFCYRMVYIVVLVLFCYMLSLYYLQRMCSDQNTFWLQENTILKMVYSNRNTPQFYHKYCKHNKKSRLIVGIFSKNMDCT